MAKSKKSQVQIRGEIEVLKIKKRNGLIQAIAALVGMVVLIILKLYLGELGVPWFSGEIGSIAIFICAIIAAAIAGMGTRTWKRSKDKIAILRQKLK